MKYACCMVMLMAGVLPATAQTVSREAQIAQAVLAAPEDRRAGAAVMGYENGTLVSLRPGTNDLICLADNPSVEGFSIACYHKDLDPFMARGRDMTAKGITDDKVRDQTRYDEIKAGTLKMPKEPRMLYVTTGKGVDAAGKVEEAYTRWVVYVPFATAEGLGLAAKPAGPGVPWLMDAGTGGAHIMISPPRQPR
ncbi:MAG: hypothetical protein IT178_10785 [Acidobacteria bacterium]|nr:hypothetical protein [Acidobacteriota bacterium]